MLVDGRHPVFLKTVNPAGRLITFDLIQLYFGEEAIREELKDHDTDRPAPNDVYLRNVNPRLRTLPVPVDATITVLDNNLAPVKEPVSLAAGGRHAAPEQPAVLDHRAPWPGGEDRRTVHPIATAGPAPAAANQPPPAASERRLRL